MDRRALLALVGCAVGTVATGRSIARAECSSDVADPKWIFPVGEYRIGIDSTGDRPARLIVMATDAEAERSYAIGAIPRGKLGAWLPLETAERVAIDPQGSASAIESSDAEVRLVYDPEPGVTTYVECSGVDIGGKAYVAATVLGTGPTSLVRLDPASGAIACAAISAKPKSVLAIYRRAGGNAIRVIVADGPELEVFGPDA